MSFSISGNTFTYEKLLNKITYDTSEKDHMYLELLRYNIFSKLERHIRLLSGTLKVGVVEIISEKGVKFSKEMKIRKWEEIGRIEYLSEIL